MPSNDLSEVDKAVSDYVAGARNYQAVCSRDNSGDFRGNNSINKAIAHNKKIIYVRNGTYNLENDLVLTSDMRIIGESKGGVILDCGNNDVQITSTGTLRTTGAGTITITNADATITGSGTTFTNYTVGDYLCVGGMMYEISVITDDTHLEIVFTYRGVTQAGLATWFVYDLIKDVELSSFTIKNSTINTNTGVIEFQYAMNSVIENIAIDDMTHGSSSPGGIYLNHCPLSTIRLNSVKNVKGVGVLLNGNGCFSNKIRENDVTGCIGKGISLIETANCLVSENDSSNNGNDGIHLGITTSVSNRNSIANNKASNNGAFGVNVSHANCSYTILVDNILFHNNDGGAGYNDGGTGTVIDNNVTS